MKFFRLSLVVGLALCAGCQSMPFTAPKYTHFQVTNYRGEAIADWTAEGFWWRSGKGYSIKAVERFSAPPYAQENHYPNGWQTTVDGPHIIHWQTTKPAWLAELDRK